MSSIESAIRNRTEGRWSSMAVFWIAVLCGLAIGQTALGQFRHPGILHSAEDLAYIKMKIQAEEQPWASAYQKLTASPLASLDWKPQPHRDVERGPYNRPDRGSTEFSSDAQAAYVQALLWALDGDVRHANLAIDLLDAWSGKLQSIGNHDARLLVGMSGFHFCVAAELMKHTSDQWAVDDQRQFASMLRKVFVPTIQNYYPTANGNWDASMLQTMMAMGVFLDDEDLFRSAERYFSSGPGNGAIRNYFLPSGQCQESGRDQGHTQMGLEFLANTCETAWIQGVDLYGAFDDRLLKGFEYTAKYNLGLDVPFEPFESYQGRYHYQELSDKGRGEFRPMYMRVYRHYHDRMGAEASYTGKAAQQPISSKRDSGRRRRSRSTFASIDSLMFSTATDWSEAKTNRCP